MTRECVTDFDELNKYVDGYKISTNLRYPNYLKSMKKMHKCYFSAVSWSAELQHEREKFLRNYDDSNEDIIFRLSETVSDLGSSFFNWMNGNYKASRVMLRVSIENFIRAVSGLEDKSQLTEKSLYKVFEIASNQKIFNNSAIPSIRSCYDILYSDYKILCADVHTATIQNMGNLTSLADFPAFQVGKSNDTEDVYVRVSKNIASIFCLVFNGFFHGMHHRNKENILNGVSRGLKPIIIAPPS
jgi:hypothetical protein